MKFFAKLISSLSVTLGGILVKMETVVTAVTPWPVMRMRNIPTHARYVSCAARAKTVWIQSNATRIWIQSNAKETRHKKNTPNIPLYVRYILKLYRLLPK